jgi:hypothetical protein
MMMNELPQHIARAALAGWLYVPSLLGGARNRRLFEDGETYCEFIGYPRSGHSLVGALLNAHPDIAVAHELAAMRYAYLGFNREQVYYLILRNARRAAREGKVLGGYVYDVPNQWQGRVRNLRVIGDKEGYGTTVRLATSARYLRRLRSIVRAKLKFIHIVRNPYDIVTTRARRVRRYAENPMLCIQDLFSLCETVTDFKETLEPDEIIELRHESFVQEPERQLAKVCSFLGVDASDEYLRDCGSIVFERPHKSRFEGPVEWDSEMIELVRDEAGRFPFLNGYSFEE